MTVIRNIQEIAKMAEKPPESRGSQTTSDAASGLPTQTGSGRSGDKVDALDPAASPPGTDTEAGSSPHDEEGLKVAREAGRKRQAGVE